MGLAAIVLIAQLFGPDATPSEAAIRELLGRYASAYNNRQHAALTDLYRSDTLLLPPNSMALKGRGEIRSFWRRYHRFYRGDAVSFEPEEIKWGGTVAYVAGKRRNGPSSRNFVLCLEKDGGHWVIAADIWNESGGPYGYQPLPGRS